MLNMIQHVMKAFQLCKSYLVFFSAPEWFGDSWMSKIKTDAGNNWRLKVRYMPFCCKLHIRKVSMHIIFL